MTTSDYVIPAFDDRQTDNRKASKLRMHIVDAPTVGDHSGIKRSYTLRFFKAPGQRFTPADGILALTRVWGGFNGGAEFAECRAVPNEGWELHIESGGSDVSVSCMAVWVVD